MKARAAFLAMVISVVLLSFTGAGFAEDKAPIPVGAAEYPDGLVYTVEEGDTLWDLSAKYLGSPWKWQEIWELNRFVTNPHYIYPGIRLVVFPPPATEITMMSGEISPSAADEGLLKKEAKGQAAPIPAVKPPTLEISPSEYVRAGEFMVEPPKGIGRIGGGEEPKVAFSEGDMVFLDLDKEIPAGQLLGVYRVRGPVSAPGGGSITGYVRYLVGLIQANGKRNGEAVGTIRTSFEDLGRKDQIREEIPAYAPVVLSPGKAGKVEALVITGQWENEELAPGQFIYLDRGKASGVAVGDVFLLSDEGDRAQDGITDKRTGVFVEVGKAVVIRVSTDFSTAYITGSSRSFPAGIKAVRGGEAGK